MERFLDVWRRLDNLWAWIEKTFVVIASLVMVGAVFGQSVMRFGFDRNLSGSSELATMLLVWVGFVSAALATRDRKHIIVDAIAKAMGERRSTWFLNGAVFVLTAAFLFYLLGASLDYLNSPGVQFRTSTVFRWPLKYVVLALPVNLAVVAIRFLQIGLEEVAIAAGKYPLDKRRVAAGIDEFLESAAPEPAIREDRQP